MMWTRRLFLTVLIWTSAFASPVPVPYDSEVPSSKIENDILSQSELSARLRRADDVTLGLGRTTLPSSTLKEESSTGPTEGETIPAESRQVSHSLPRCRLIGPDDMNNRDAIVTTYCISISTIVILSK
jgi:hypothetical protein